MDPVKDISQYVHDVWDTKNGLPQNSIQAICQTRDGFIWLGTEEGLVRFDGMDFEVWNDANTPEIKNNDVMALIQDRNGWLWIGTYGGGVLGYRDGRFRSLSTENGLPSDIINTLYEDHNGTIWIGTGKGLVSVEKEEIRIFGKEEGLSSDVVMALCSDSQGNLIIGTTGGGLNIYDGKKISHVPLKNISPTLSIRSLYRDRSDHIWIGTERNGVIHCDGGGYVIEPDMNGLISDTIFSMEEDGDGNLWIGTNGRGIFRYNRGVLTGYSHNDGLSNDIIRAILHDREGNVWIGTRGGGLNRFMDGKLTTYTTRAGLSSGFIRSICEDKNGTLWVGTNRGLNRFNGESFSLYGERYLSMSVITSIVCDRLGGLWIGTYGDSFFHYDGATWTQYPSENSLQHDFIKAMYQDIEDCIWIGTLGGGIIKYGEDRFTSFSTKNGLYSDVVYSIYEDSSRNLWVGTGIGLNCIREDRVVSYPLQTDLSQEVILCFFEDETGILYLGSNGSGLFKIKDGLLSKYTIEDGIFADKIYSIQEDDLDRLWMSCGKGIFCLEKDDLDEFDEGKISQIPCSIFDEEDGMKSRECSGTNQPVSCRSKNGSLWFATIQGLTMIEPMQTKINRIPPVVFIKYLELANEFFSPDQNIILPPGRKNLIVHFNALSYTAPDKIRFLYKLESYDDDWKPVGIAEERTARYSGLLPGSYRFLIRASNKDGVWNPDPVFFEFSIRPYFYQTSWFAVISILLFLMGGISLPLIHRRRIRIREKNKYKTSTLNTQKADRYLTKLLALMDENKPYTNPEISIAKLAAALDIPQSHLSELINRRLKKNFNEFINQYRVEEIKKRILDPEYRHMKLIALCFDVGFNSKSSFNTAFKKHVGMTPSEFRKKHPKQS